MSFTKFNLSIAMLVGIGSFATGCADQPEKSADAQHDTAEAREGTAAAPAANAPTTPVDAPTTPVDVREISGRVNIAAYALDNPVVVAQTDGGRTYAVSVAADGSFAFKLPCEQTYRLFLANSVSSGSFRAKTIIRWNTEGGASIWARWGQGGTIALGDIEPLESSSCSWCGGYSYGYNANYGYSANYSYGANYGYNYNFGYSADYNYNFNYNYNYKYNANWRWGWQTSGSLVGSWGGSFSGALSGAFSGSYEVKMCLDYEARVASQISTCSGAAVSAVFAAETHVELGGGCEDQQPARKPSQSGGSGDECGVNADCNANAFCAQSVCRDVSN